MTDAERQFRERSSAVGEGFQFGLWMGVHNAGEIYVGNQVEFSGASNITFSNIVTKKPQLRIGDHTFIGDGCHLYIARGIEIGSHCLISAGVQLRDFDGHPMDAIPRRTLPTPPSGIGAVRVGNDVWIGGDALVLKGVTIGDRAVIAAMSVVVSDVPPDTLFAGNPARAVRMLNGKSMPPDGPAPRGGTAAERVKSIVAEHVGLAAEAIDAAYWVTHYGIDSLQLLLLRESLESELGVRLSDRRWLGFESIAQVIDFVDGRERRSFAPAEIREAQPPRGSQPEVLETTVDIGLPLTGRNQLSEGPLLQVLGDLRWKHIRELAGVPATRIVDEAGERLYATFFYIDLAFSEDLPMAAYQLDDHLRVTCDLRRFGTSILDGTFRLSGVNGESASTQRDACVRVSNIFVAQHNGAEWLRKSRPAQAGFLRIPEMETAPDSIARAKQASEEGSFGEAPEHYLSLVERPVKVRYQIVPDRDLNGAGLLYFAHYPVFLDIAEREALRKVQPAVPEELIDLRTTVRRESAYLSNASAGDELLIVVEPWLRNPFAAGDASPEESPIHLWINFRMCRASDARLMMVSTVRKVIYRKTMGDLPGLERLAIAS